jgi:hypothetical protein
MVHGSVGDLGKQPQSSPVGAQTPRTRSMTAPAICRSTDAPGYMLVRSHEEKRGTVEFFEILAAQFDHIQRHPTGCSELDEWTRIGGVAEPNDSIYSEGLCSCQIRSKTDKVAV